MDIFFCFDFLIKEKIKFGKIQCFKVAKISCQKQKMKDKKLEAIEM
jgi:hypothetical protein